MIRSSFALAALLVAASARAAEPVDTFNYVVGTQLIGARYQFTGKPRLLELAEANRDLGAGVIKFAMGPGSFGYDGHFRNIPARPESVRTLVDLANEPAHRAALDLPHGHVILWTYALGAHGWDAAARAREYPEIRAFAEHLLKTYNGSGRTFYLGHWEGDWSLAGPDHRGPDGRVSREIRQERVDEMIEWLRMRQRAIDDARAAVPHRNVQVYHYTEVNLVQRAMTNESGAFVVRDVLPHVPVDFVSYSAYDSQNGDLEQRLPAALSYIESKLQPRPGLAGKRVFIGEHGRAFIHGGAKEQDKTARRMMRSAIDWGCPFVLYWELYNNEVDEKTGAHRGYWMIDNEGARQPVYDTHHRFLEEARAYVAAFRKREARDPTAAEFRAEALRLLEDRP